jgi:hypothetical protein
MLRLWSRMPSFGLVFAAVTCMMSTRTNAQSSETFSSPSDRAIPGVVATDGAVMSVEHVDPVHATSILLFSTLRKDDLLPRDIAVELLPWFPTTRGGGEPVSEQFERLEDLGGLDGIGRYAAFSVSISQDVESRFSNETTSLVALGARTLFVAGRLNGLLSERIADYRSATDQLDKAEKKLETQPKGAAPDAAAEQELALLLLRTRDLLNQIAITPKNRVGFLLEVGGAQVFRSPENSLSQAHVARRAVWVTPFYRFDVKPVDLAATLRVIGERESHSRLVDIGGRIGARRGGVYYSFEGLGRWRSAGDLEPGDDGDYGRAVGGIAYGFNRSTQVHFTFGKNFSRDFSNGGSLSAGVGLTIGVGEVPTTTISDAN